MRKSRQDLRIFFSGGFSCCSIPQKLIAVIMAMMDFVAFIGGLTFVKARRVCKGKTKYLAPVLFFIGYLLMALPGGWAGTLTGSAMIGFANGAGIPFIISEASMKAGKSAAVTVLPLISAALYLAQFICPIIMSAVTAALGGLVPHLPYYFAALLALIFCFWSVQIRLE